MIDLPPLEASDLLTWLLIALGAWIAFGRRLQIAAARLDTLPAAPSVVSRPEVEAIAARVSNLERERKDDSRQLGEIEGEMRDLSKMVARLEERIIQLTKSVDGLAKPATAHA